MALELQKVTHRDSVVLLKLLQERKPWQNISHKSMPSWDDHVAFVKSEPYKHWWIIRMNAMILGACYITHRNEISIQFLEGKQSCYHLILTVMLEKAGPGTYYANVNPVNARVIRLFESEGFKHIQNTYEKEVA